MKPLPRSIALRLTIAIGAIALAVFAGAGVLLHRALADELARADHEELVGKIKLVEHFIDEAKHTGDAHALAHHLDDLLLGHADLRVWLEAADATPFYGGAAPQPLGRADRGGRFRVLRADGVAMTAIEQAVADAAPLPIARIRVALETRPRERLLAAYRNAVVGICALGVLLTVGLSALAARRGLRPVQRLSAEAQRITPHSLATRLSPADIDDELTGLVHAFNGVLDRLESAYQKMEAFNADVAHELRTPLAVLMSGTHLMLSAAAGQPKLSELLLSQTEELEAMAALVNDMLFLARADQGDRAQALEPVDLAAAAEQTIAYCEPLLAEAGVSAVRRGQASALCNEALLRRALANLLSNAIRHTAADQRVVLCVQQRRGEVRVAVQNPGRPIPPHIAERMFERFFRADAAGPRAGPGFGLGLSIVRAVAQMHCGGVFYERDGDCNRIGLWLPASRAVG